MAAIGGPERLLPLLSFFGLVMAVATAERCLATRRVAGGIVGCVIALLLLICAWPSVGRIGQTQRETLRSPDFRATLTGLEGVSAAKDAAGLTRVLQLPIVPLAPAPLRPAETGDQSLLPFLMDRAHPPARWSAGAADDGLFRTLRAGLHPAIDPAGLPVRARGQGFDGILLDRGIYSADTVAAIEGGLTAGSGAPDSCRAYTDPNWLLLRLGAPGQPCAPAAPAEAPRRYSLAVQQPGGVDLLDEHWRPSPEGAVTTANVAGLLLPVPGGQDDVSVTLLLSSEAPLTVTLLLNEEPLAQDLTIGSQTPAPYTVTVPRAKLGSGSLFRLALKSSGAVGPITLRSLDVVSGPR